jgi:hypothetical protein
MSLPAVTLWDKQQNKKWTGCKLGYINICHLYWIRHAEGECKKTGFLKSSRYMHAVNLAKQENGRGGAQIQLTENGTGPRLLSPCGGRGRGGGAERT